MPRPVQISIRDANILRLALVLLPVAMGAPFQAAALQIAGDLLEQAEAARDAEDLAAV